MNICVIPARGGSKRIPLKNIKIFNGKPIIAYSIEAALQSGCFDKVIVSTDDIKISKIAIRYGAEVPYMRPQKLSTDYIGTLPVIKHAVEWVEKNETSLKFVCCLYATAPFVKGNFLKQSLKQLKDSRLDYCFSATSYSFPVQRAIKLTDNNTVKMYYPEFQNSRSQDLEKTYHDAGQFYWGKMEAYKKMQPIFSEFSTPYILPKKLVQDIDTHEDWQRAELMHKIIFD